MDYQVFPRGQLLSMAGRHVPQVGLYNLNSQNTGAQYVASALHDLNTVDSRNGDMESLGDADQDAAAGDSLDNEEDESNSGEDGVPGSYGNSMALQPIGADSVHLHLQGQDTARPPYGTISPSGVATYPMASFQPVSEVLLFQMSTLWRRQKLGF